MQGSGKKRNYFISKVKVCILRIVPIDSTYLLHTSFISSLNLISLRFSHLEDFPPTRKSIRTSNGHGSFGRSYLIYLKKQQLKCECISRKTSTDRSQNPPLGIHQSNKPAIWIGMSFLSFILWRSCSLKVWKAHTENHRAQSQHPYLCEHLTFQETLTVIVTNEI